MSTRVCIPSYTVWSIKLLHVRTISHSGVSQIQPLLELYRNASDPNVAVSVMDNENWLWSLRVPKKSLLRVTIKLLVVWVRTNRYHRQYNTPRWKTVDTFLNGIDPVLLKYSDDFFCLDFKTESIIKFFPFKRFRKILPTSQHRAQVELLKYKLHEHICWNYSVKTFLCPAVRSCSVAICSPKLNI